MFRGLYTAGSAMISNSKRIDIVSNNLANIDTNSFKKDIALSESFEEVLISKRNGLHSNNNFSRDGFSYTEYKGTYSLKAPNAFIKMDGKAEMNYSKEALIHVDEEGYLSTFYKDGNGEIYPEKGSKIYGKNGYIQVGDQQVSFDGKGNVLLDGVISDNLLVLPPPNVIGTIGSGVLIERTETLFEQGQLERTDYAYDIAIDGEGFFEVETPFGNMYTRDGKFKANSFGEIVTSDGYNVLGLNGKIEATGDNVQINHFGEIIIDGETKDKLRVANIKNTFDLKKVGAGYYVFEDGYELQEEDFVGDVRQGYVEKSNANNLTEMISLLELYRSYESNQRMVVAYDQTLDKAVNDIGRV